MTTPNGNDSGAAKPTTEPAGTRAQAGAYAPRAARAPRARAAKPARLLTRQPLRQVFRAALA